jgi:hypothetical protein
VRWRIGVSKWPLRLHYSGTDKQQERDAGPVDSQHGGEEVGVVSPDRWPRESEVELRGWNCGRVRRVVAGRGLVLGIES